MAETRMGPMGAFLLGGDAVDGSEIRRENGPGMYKTLEI